MEPPPARSPVSAAEAAAESLSAADRGALLGLCSGLGAPRQVAGVGLRYVKEEDTQECLESLISYLRRDDPTRAVVLQLADWNTARGHVVPLLVAYAHSFELLFAATKVAVFLTLPSEPPAVEPGKSASAAQVAALAAQTAALQKAKAALLEQPAALTAVVQLLAEPLQRFAERGRLSEEDWKVVQLVLTLLRNLLAIPDPRPTTASGGDHLTRGRELLLDRLFGDEVTDLLLAVTQDAARQPFRNEAALLLEIFFELFRGASPEALFAASARRAAAAAAVASGVAPGHAARKDLEAAQALRDALGGERAAADWAARGLGCAPRHGRFGGQYARRAAGPAAGTAGLVRGSPFAPLASAQAGLAPGRAAFGRGRPQLLGPAGAGPPLGWSLAAGHADAAFAAQPPAGPACAQGSAAAARLCGLADAFLAGPYDALMAVVLGDLLGGRAPGLSRAEAEARTRHFLRLQAFAADYAATALTTRPATATHERAGKEAADAAAAAAAVAADAGAAAAAGGGVEGAAPGAAPIAAPPPGRVARASPWACVSSTLGCGSFGWLRSTLVAACDARPVDAALVDACGAALRANLAALQRAAATGGPDGEVAKALAFSLLRDDTADEGLLATTSRLLRRFDPHRTGARHAADVAGAMESTLLLAQALAQQDGGLLVRARGRGTTRRPRNNSGSAKATADAGDAGHEAADDQNAGGTGAASGGDAAATAAAAAAAATAGPPAPPGGGVVGARERDVAAALQEGGIDMDVEGSGEGEGLGEGEEGEGERPARLVQLDVARRCAGLLDPQSVCNLVWLLRQRHALGATALAPAVALLTRLHGLHLRPLLFNISVVAVMEGVLSDPLIGGGRPLQPQWAPLVALARDTLSALFDALRHSAQPLPAQPAQPALRPAGKGGEEGDAAAAAAAAAAADAAEDAARASELARRRANASHMLFLTLPFWQRRAAAATVEQELAAPTAAPPAARRAAATARDAAADADAADAAPGQGRRGGAAGGAGGGAVGARRRSRGAGGVTLSDADKAALRRLASAYAGEEASARARLIVAQLERETGVVLTRAQLRAQLLRLDGPTHRGAAARGAIDLSDDDDGDGGDARGGGDAEAGAEAEAAAMGGDSGAAEEGGADDVAPSGRVIRKAAPKPKRAARRAGRRAAEPLASDDDGGKGGDGVDGDAGAAPATGRSAGVATLTAVQLWELQQADSSDDGGDAPPPQPLAEPARRLKRAVGDGAAAGAASPPAKRTALEDSDDGGGGGAAVAVRRRVVVAADSDDG